MASTTSIKPSPIKIATFNVNNAKIEEKWDGKHPLDTRWDNRCPLVASLINTCGADIVCLQEVRTLETSKYNLKTFLSMLNYDHHYVYYSEKKNEMALVILWNSSKFIPMAFDLGYYDNPPLADGSVPVDNKEMCYFGIGFKEISEPLASFKTVGTSTGVNFWVYNTHFSVAEARKWASVNNLVAKFSEDSKNMVIAGDFNFFSDMDGDKQRRKMLEVFPVDLAYPITSPIALPGSFIGFDNNAFKKTPDTMARLDHVFARGFTRVGEVTAFGATLENLTNRTYPSDHVMLMIDVVPML